MTDEFKKLNQLQANSILPGSKGSVQLEWEVVEVNLPIVCIALKLRLTSISGKIWFTYPRIGSNPHIWAWIAKVWVWITNILILWIQIIMNYWIWLRLSWWIYHGLTAKWLRIIVNVSRLMINCCFFLPIFNLFSFVVDCIWLGIPILLFVSEFLIFTSFIFGHWGSAISQFRKGRYFGFLENLRPSIDFNNPDE